MVLLAAVVIQVFGEMMHGAGGWELSFTLAPPDKHGQYQGFFGMAPQIARMLGPLLLTTLLIRWGTPGWLVPGGLFLLAGLAIGPAMRHAERADVDTTTAFRVNHPIPAAATRRATVGAAGLVL